MSRLTVGMIVVMAAMAASSCGRESPGEPSSCTIRGGTWSGEAVQFNVDAASCTVTERGSRLAQAAAVVVGPVVYGPPGGRRQVILYGYSEARIVRGAFSLSALAGFTMQGAFPTSSEASGTIQYDFPDEFCGLGRVTGSLVWRASPSASS